MAKKQAAPARRARRSVSARADGSAPDATETPALSPQQRTLEAMHEAIIFAAKDGVIAVDERQTIVLINPAAEVIFGYAAADILGRPLAQLIPASARAAHERHLRHYAARHDPVRVMANDRVVTGLRADGSEFPVDVTISQIDVYGARRYVAVVRDITERKSMEVQLLRLLEEQREAESAARDSRDRLRELSAALQTIREEEKTRIARELHDELGQTLTALKMDAVAIAGELGAAQESVRRRTEGMTRLIDATVASVRRIAADLRPVMLDNLGLAPTLEWLVKEFSGRTGIRVDLEIPDENLGLDGDAATAVFRIVQEALTNVSRHAGADWVGVEVQLRGGNVVVRINDNGKGFAEADTHKVRSFGLLGMRERAYVLGGELNISSSGSMGTQIEAVIPLCGKSEGRAP